MESYSEKIKVQKTSGGEVSQTALRCSVSLVSGMQRLLLISLLATSPLSAQDKDIKSDGSSMTTKAVLSTLTPDSNTDPQNQEREKMFEAIEGGNLRAVRRLIKQGVGLNIKDEDGSTPLHLALDLEQQEIAQFLIENGADINIKNEWGYTPIHCVIYSGNLFLARLLIQKGANVNAQDTLGYAPLHNAADLGYFNLAKLLVEKGAECKLKNLRGETPLAIAKKRSKLEIVRLLSSKACNR